MRSISKAIARTLLGVTMLAFMATPALAYYDLDDGYYYTTSSADAASAGLFYGTTGLIFTCCIILVSFGINFALAYFVYRDAQKNKVDNGALWAVITFFFNIIGLLVYFLAIRPDAVKRMEAQGGGVKKEESTN